MTRLAALALALAGLASTAAAETVALEGREVYYEVHGDLGTGGAPVLVLHGGMMTVEATYGALIPRLSQGRAVIGVEQQGHGHTPDHGRPLTPESMRADTLGVLDALKVDRVHVIGFSLGGMLALDLAVNAPARVASVTAISASQNGEGMLPDLIAMNRDPSFKPSPEVAALLPTEADFAAMTRGFAENPSGPQVFQTTMAKVGALISGDWGWSDEQLAGIKAPAQLVLGDNDFVLPGHAVHMAQTIPEAWLAVLPDTTHMSILAHPALPQILAHRIDTAEAP